MIPRYLLNAAAVACLLPAACLFAQEEEAPVVRRPSIGVRFEYAQTRGFITTSADTSTTKPVADYHYSAGTPSRGMILTPTLEYRSTPSKLSVGLEFHFLHAQYRQTIEIRSGKKDPTSSTDDRNVTTVTETTRASYWEFPLLAHYYGFGGGWFSSRAYATGGLAVRHIGNIRSGTEYAYADETTDYNEIQANADRTNQLGVVAGLGLRFVDDYRIKIAPEVRYTRWFGTTFHGPAFRSVNDQLTVGLGFSF